MIYKSARREKAASAMMALEEANDVMAAGAQAPVETVRTTYSVWSLGKKTVTPGDRQRLKIKEENWPAQFLFLARPSVSPQAYLQAKIQLPGPTEIPSGKQRSSLTARSSASVRSRSRARRRTSISATAPSSRSTL